LEAQFEETQTCLMTITGNISLPQPWDSYSVYIDGNYATPQRQDVNPSNGTIVWLLPGEHRVVVRESEVKKVNRLKSNTLWFSASEGVPLHFEVGLSNRQLNLIQLESFSQ
jgi:archaellum component FlaG (FlaF/FlaG flagellin family)